MDDGEQKFGTQCCPVELENEEEEIWVLGHRSPLKALVPGNLAGAGNLPGNFSVKAITESPRAINMMENSDLKPRFEMNSDVQHVPEKEILAPKESENLRIAKPGSPSIEQSENPRVAEPGNPITTALEYPRTAEPENPRTAEGLRALDATAHGCTLSRPHVLESGTSAEGPGTAAEAYTTHIDGADAGALQKTELEREMELYEAAEREEEARLLTSLRNNQSGELSPSPRSPSSMENTQVDRKRGPNSGMAEEHRPKRGRKPAISYQAPRKEEDVCFVCFDGGKLILCDKRSCPKAYHMECTGRESEFFRKKGQWLCGWHVCAHCSRSATLHCYTCPNAYCNNCVREADFLCIRKGRGLCEVCYPIVNMIEHNLSINSEGVQVDFNDEETYECLFKEYWKDLKQKLTLTWAELDKACKAKDAGEMLGNSQAEGLVDEDDDDSTDSGRRPVTRQSQRLKRKRMARSAIVEDVSDSEYEEEEDGDDEDEDENKPKRGRRRVREFVGWASKELVDFLQSMREDSKKPLSLLSLNKLLWAYVETHKLVNPRRRGQIMCDEKLQSLFGKKHVGKYEMMKLISVHIASKKTTAAKSWDFPSGGDDDVVELDNSDDKRLKQRKSRKKLEDTRHLKPDPSDYAAIDVKNISLIYLKRSLLDDLRNDPDFESKVVGAFVRIRVPGMVNKSDTCYRLVQIVGIKQGHDTQNNVKVTDVILEILNLQKREEVTVDLVSSQDFTEEECQRLRQSVKCGLLKAMTVGELRAKARALREAKVKDWFETELLRLSHLRDRASEKGRKKELRECVEKLQVLNSPAERERQLRAPIEINTDPHMDPNYESDGVGVPSKNNQGTQSPWDRASSQKIWEKSGVTEKPHNHSDNGSLAEANPYSGTWESKPKVAGWGQKDYGKDNPGPFAEKQVQGWGSANNDRSTVSGEFKRRWADNVGISKKDDGWGDNGGGNRRDDGWGDNVGGNSNDDGWGSNDNRKDHSWGPNVSSAERSPGWNNQANSRNDGFLDKREGMYRSDSRPPHNRTEGSDVLSGGKMTTGATHVVPTTVGASGTGMAMDSEKEKVWYYQDPSKTTQGPFAMEQLRKWEKTKLFPLDLRVWRITESQDAAILLTDALLGKHHNNFPPGFAQRGEFNVESYSHVGSSASGGDSRNASVPGGGRPGSSWQERGGRAGESGGSSINASAWGNNWVAEKHHAGHDSGGWGARPERAWGSQGPGKPPPHDSGRDESFRGNWGRGTSLRGPADHHRFDRPGNDGKFSTKKKDFPCRYFARGMCKKGQDCDFRH